MRRITHTLCRMKAAFCFLWIIRNRIGGMMEKNVWLLAISGGPDSIAMFHMMLEKGVPFAVAIVNYRTRETSDEEVQYVKSLCEKYHVECFVYDEPIAWSYNFEAQARDIRYTFFEKLVKEHHFSGVMVAHHQDDNIETYILQTQKGITPTTYGLPEKTTYHDITIYRPLLSYTKKQLLSYCDKRHLKYYIDDTNFDNSNARSILRNTILKDLDDKKRQSYLEEIQKKNTKLQQIRNEALSLFDAIGIDKEKYKKSFETVRLFALRYLLQKVDPHISDKFLMQIDKMVKAKDFLCIVKEYMLYPFENHICIKQNETGFCFEVGSFEELMKFDKRGFVVKTAGEKAERLAVGKDDFPLRIRNYQEGDIIRMRFGHKRVSRFFIDRHIPLYQRNTWLVVENRCQRVIFVHRLGADTNHYENEGYCYLCEK